MEDIEEKKDGTVVDKTELVPGTEQVQTPTKRDQLRSLLNDEIPGYNADDDESSAEMLMGYINGNKEQRNKLAEALQQDPRLAQMLADIVNSKRGAGNAMARYFGKDLLTEKKVLRNMMIFWQPKKNGSRKWRRWRPARRNIMITLKRACLL